MTRRKEKSEESALLQSLSRFLFLPPESYISVERAVDRRVEGKGNDEGY